MKISGCTPSSQAQRTSSQRKLRVAQFEMKHRPASRSVRDRDALTNIYIGHAAKYEKAQSCTPRLVCGAFRPDRRCALATPLEGRCKENKPCHISHEPPLPLRTVNSALKRRARTLRRKPTTHTAARGGHVKHKGDPQGVNGWGWDLPP